MDEIEILQQQVKLVQQEGDKTAEYALLGQLGNTAFSLENLPLARESYETALHLARSLDNLYGIGATLSNLGSVYIALADPERAMEYCQEALTIARQIEDRVLEGKTLNNLGLAFYRLGRLRKSIEYYQEALTIAKKIHAYELQESARTNLDLARAAANLATNVNETRQMSLEATQARYREIGIQASATRRKIATATRLRVMAITLIITVLAATAILWILSRGEIIPSFWLTVLSSLLGGLGVVASLLLLIQMYLLRQPEPQVNEI